MRYDVYYCSTVCVFITSGPSTKLFTWGGGGDMGGHVLRETTSRGLYGLGCPSRTSERVGEGDCVKEGGYLSYAIVVEHPHTKGTRCVRCVCVFITAGPSKAVCVFITAGPSVCLLLQDLVQSLVTAERVP
jgi:hypothetical protein